MTLIEIQKNFAIWRENRSHSKEKIPDELWQQVASIYSTYPISTICRKLGLSSQALRRAMQDDGFASYVPSASSAEIINELGDCELSLERMGTRLSVKIPLTSLDNVLSRFAAYLPC